MWDWLTLVNLQNRGTEHSVQTARLRRQSTVPCPPLPGRDSVSNRRDVLGS